MFTYNGQTYPDYDELAEQCGFDTFLAGKAATAPTPERIGMGRALIVLHLSFWGDTIRTICWRAGDVSYDAWLGFLRGSRLPAKSRLKVIAEGFGTTVEKIEQMAAELIPAPVHDYQI